MATDTHRHPGGPRNVLVELVDGHRCHLALEKFTINTLRRLAGRARRRGGIVGVAATTIFSEVHVMGYGPRSCVELLRVV
jgi:hypothetical protein